MLSESRDFSTETLANLKRRKAVVGNQIWLRRTFLGPEIAAVEVKCDEHKSQRDLCYGHPLEPVPYRHILHLLDEADTWLRGIGFLQNDRLRVHRRNVHALVEWFEGKRATEAVSDGSEERTRQLLWSMVEATEFVEAITALRDRNCSVPTELLERALKGPADPYYENADNNKGRNAMFEIALAGRFASAGLTPLFGGEPDILVEFRNRFLLLQCKRVISEPAFSKRAAEAADQLKRDLNRRHDPKDCGLIAISLSKLINAGDKLLFVSRTEQIRHELRSQVADILHHHKALFNSFRHPKIAGVYLEVITPAFVDELDMNTRAEYGGLFHFENKSDAALLKGLAQTLMI